MQSTTPAEQLDLKKPNTPPSNDDPDQIIVELARQLRDCTPHRTSFTIPARLKQFIRFLQECY
ncbi:MAG: hypothetical protein ACXW4Q_17000, partial [Anaerolineales bacterium]